MLKLSKPKREKLIAAIKGGASIREVANGNKRVYQVLYNHCCYYGIDMNVRQIDANFRKRTIKEYRANKKPWRMVAAKIAKREGRVVGLHAVREYAIKHGIAA